MLPVEPSTATFFVAQDIGQLQQRRGVNKRNGADQAEYHRKTSGAAYDDWFVGRQISVTRREVYLKCKPPVARLVAMFDRMHE